MDFAAPFSQPRQYGAMWQGSCRVNRDHPLGKFVVFFYAPSHFGHVDLAHMNPASFTSGFTSGSNAKGKTGANNGSANCTFAHHPDYNVLGSITILWGGIVTDFAAIREICSKLDNATSPNNIPFTTYWNASNANKPGITRAHGSAYGNFNGNSAPTAGAYTTYGVSQGADISVSPIGVLNGAALSFGANTGSGSGNATGNTRPLSIGIRDDSATQAKGDCNFCIVLNVQLSQAQMQALLADPFQLLEPIAPPWWMTSGASGPTYTLALANGTFTVTGQSLGMLASRKLSLAQGSFAVNGQSLGMLASRKFPLASGNFAVTGQALNMLASRVWTLGQGSFAVTGQALNFTKVFVLGLGAGAFSITGEPLSMIASRKISLAAGSFNIVGNPVGLLAQRKLSLGAGSYSVSGQSLRMVASRVLTLARGLFSVVGQALGMSVGSAEHFGRTPRFVFSAEQRDRSFKADVRNRSFRAPKRKRSNKD